MWTPLPIDLTDLTDEQRGAVVSEDDYIVVLAGPGSGKTKTLTRKLEYLLKTHGPAPIAVVTFTHKAARELRERLKDLSPELMEHVFVGTFHSLCARILRQDPRAVGLREGFSVFPRPQGKTEAEVRGYYLATLLDEHIAKSAKPYTITAAVHALDWRDEKLDPVFLQNWNAELIRRNMVDYDLLVQMTLDLVENRNRGPWFDYVLVDEAQDTDDYQQRIIHAIGRKFFLVGDDWQAIYTWRHAYPEWLHARQVDHPIHYLTLNHRSTPEICEALNRLMRNEEGAEKKVLRSAIESKLWPVQFYKSENPIHEAKDIGRWIALDHLSTPREYSQIAILSRTHHRLDEIRAELTRRRIPIHAPDPVVQRMKTEEFQGLLTTLRQEPTPSLVGVLSEEYLPQFCSLLSLHWPDLQRTINDLTVLLNRYLRRCHETPTLFGFTQWIDNSHPDDLAETDDLNGVFVNTIHAAKGLEFDAVFVVGLEEGCLPQTRLTTDYAEEKRLLYVAMSRARYNLYLCHCNETKAWPQAKKCTAVKESSFLAEIR